MKINIQKQSNKKSTYRAILPCSTTLNFGQTTPIFAKELVPNSQITIDVNNFVRTAVMSLPTFGDYKLLTHAVFVPYSSLYKPFDSLLSKTKYNVGSSYIPTQVPVVAAETLLSSLYIDDKSNTDHSVLMVVEKVNSPLSLASSSDITSLNQAIGTTFPTNMNSVQVPDKVTPRKDFLLYEASGAKYYLQFSEQIKYIVRILNGLGYTFGQSDYMSALPLMAITKSMFDLFSPQQSDTENLPFESTYLYTLIMNKLIGANGYVFTKTDVQELFKMLIDNTYYINDDFIAMHSLNIATSQVESITLSSASPITQSTTSPENELQTNFTDKTGLTSDRLKAIFRIGALLKSNTQIAGRLKEFLRSRFGSSVGDNHDTIVVKSILTDIDISDIFATASTTGDVSSVLGEYGGRAIGKGNGVVKFESNCFGIFMLFATIIQRRNYFCGANPDIYHKQTNDFYNPAFDSLGYTISNKAIFNGGRNQLLAGHTASFGYKPRYLEYKFFHPVVAGDFNRPSQRNTLDAFIGSAYPNNDAQPIYSKELNKPAFHFPLYNYNNIFYEHETWASLGQFGQRYYDAISDPFIIHTLLKITMHAPMLSIGDSFETNEGNPMEVEKA